MLTGMILGIGLAARLVLWVYYALLGAACKHPDSTKNKAICNIREELRERIESGIGIRSAAIYMECRLAKCKVLGIRLGVWEGISEQAILLVMLTGTLSSLGGVLWECESKLVLAMLFLGGMSAVVLLSADLLIGLREKHNRTRLCIRDYIENFCLLAWDRQGSRSFLNDTEALTESGKAQLRQEKGFPGGEENKGGQTGKEECQNAREKKKELHSIKKEERRAEKVRKREERSAERAGKKEAKERKHSLGRERREAKKQSRKEKRQTAKVHGAKRQGQCKAQLEKRRLTEELLRERRQLEARQLAEQKRYEPAAEDLPKPEREEKAERVVRQSAEKPEGKPAGSIGEQTENAMEQAQAEAAAADHSYEALLREVLAEYLA